MQNDTESKLDNLDEEKYKYIYDVRNVVFPDGIKHCFYPTNTRGDNTKGSYLLYLPPSYEINKDKRYPVIYFLHGGDGTTESGLFAMENYGKAIREGKMTEVIIVSPKGCERYVDSVDIKYPSESVIIKDLLPHVDSTYRTIQNKFARGIEGQSMGGYGVLRFCFKYPEKFGTALSVAPSIDRNLSDEPWGIGDTFGHNQEYFEEVGPWNLAKLNADRFNKSNNKLRLIVGDKDGLLNTDTNYHNFLNDLKINHEFFIVPGAAHNYSETLTNYGDEVFKFWKENLKN